VGGCMRMYVFQLKEREIEKMRNSRERKIVLWKIESDRETDNLKFYERN